MPPASVPKDSEERRRPTLPLLTAGLVMTIAACAGGDAEPGPAPAPTQASGTIAAVTQATASPGVGSATTADPGAAARDPYVVAEPRDVSIEWTCDEPRERGGGFGSACQTRSRDPLFAATNLTLVIDYTVDEDGNPVSMAVFARAYGPACEWDPVDTDRSDAPVVDGKATHEGVLLGSGHCEGVRWVYQNTWDVQAHTVVTTGTVEPAA